ncbi:DUF4224 domain-containing protein [Chitiniphilus purpureus]|uniref:DUF4224 domain-containing protein n=1 Tax=Chitiniphilus purpureus TaxID=2981137 RepID=A0ABY6DQU1_9NEIS|nr:DUF4224 domain-containing protein [Chitiniphilus sp. CD1]UXY16687.1 DUF4224 domain-containing protein [Chitiniphilus sp. CD1]
MNTVPSAHPVVLIAPSPWLSRQELVDLVGDDKAARVRHWLKKNQIPFLLALNGWPQVSRAKVREALGEQLVGDSQEQGYQPNFGALG